MGSRVVPTTANPGPRCFSKNQGTGRSTVSSEAIVKSDGMQIGKASKAVSKKLNNAEETLQRCLPQAKSHKSADMASQGGYQR